VFRSQFDHDVDRVYSRVVGYGDRYRLQCLGEGCYRELFSASHLDSVLFQSLGEFCLRSASASDGVTVIYGENMRGKTSLLNAIRFAFFGKVLGGATDAMITATILLVLGVGLVGIAPASVLIALGLCILLAIGMVSIGLTLGAFFESMEGFQVVVTFMVFPLFFLSGALYPLKNLDPAMAAAVRLDPVTYAVDGMRGTLIGVQHFPMWLDVGVLVVFDLLMIVVGTLAFRKMKL